MASDAGTRGTALLFSFSAILFLFLLLLQAPGLAVADLVRSALDRLLDGRGLLELATRRNMILLCHAILLLILRDAGVLGAPARRRSRSPPAEATAVVAQAAAPPPVRAHATRGAVVAQTASCSAVPVPAQTHATRTTVVWRRRPRDRAAVAMHDAAAATRRLVEYQPGAEAAATWAAPVLTTGRPGQEVEESAGVAAKQIVVAESPREDDDDDDLLDRHDRAAVVEPLDDPTAIAADGERDDCDDRRIIVIADDEKRVDDQTAGLETEMELADDRTFEEFIESQRRQMRQESLRLQQVSSGNQYQATATCY